VFFARHAVIALAVAVAACGAGGHVTRGDGEPHVDSGAVDESASRDPVTLSFVGTNDLHGHIRALPLLAGYVQNIRQARERDGGGVLLVDAGDMFQGTLESNLVEGASVIAGMNALEYTASTVGNHEFDFGPVGPATTPTGDGDNPRGALIARAAESRFPILMANILAGDTRERADWHENMPPTRLVEVAGVMVGIIGVTTKETLRTTISGNVRDLEMGPIVDTIRAYTDEVRGQGAEVVVVTAHAGGKCEDCSDPTDATTCEPSQEIFEVARALPEGFVDLIVAGHTHRGVAHEINGIPIIEAYSYGIAFGRVDIVVRPDTGAVLERNIHPPRFLCEDQGQPFETCEPGEYEGAPVRRVGAVAAVIAPFVEQARDVEARDLGVRVEGEFPHVIDEESAIGNLLADLIRATVDDADIGLMNGGGIRDGIDEGPLTYGELHRVFPFDNRLATARITGAELAAMVRRTLAGGRSIDSYSGVRVRVTCRGGEVQVGLRREGGRAIRDDEELVLVASDFLVTGGNDVLTAAWRDGRVTLDEGDVMRDQLAERLSDIGRVRAGVRFDARRPRLRFDGERPVSCAE